MCAIGANIMSVPSPTPIHSQFTHSFKSVLWFIARSTLTSISADIPILYCTLLYNAPLLSPISPQECVLVALQVGLLWPSPLSIL